MKTGFCAAAVALAMTCGLSAIGSIQAKPDPAKSGTAQAAEPANADGTFMKTAAMDGMAEVAHGKLAAQHAASAEVKQFGQRMVEDHGTANAELKSLASQKNVALPTELNAKHKAMQDKLSQLKGAAFDSAYMAHMVTAHKEAVALFQGEAKTGKDAETKAFAEKTLPALQEHLKMAQELAGKSKSY